VKRKQYPFSNWNVLCILNNEKNEALLRIIEAGKGKAILYNNNVDQIKNPKFTLIVYSDDLKSMAESQSIKYKVPCYPYQAIPDYLMLVSLKLIKSNQIINWFLLIYSKAEYSRLPLLSVSYYSTEIKTKNVDDSFDFGYNIEKLEQTFLSSYMSLLICANTTIENSVNKTFFQKKQKS
jgi:hypothetical protein